MNPSKYVDLEGIARAYKLNKAPWLAVGYYISRDTASEYLAQAYPVIHVSDWCVDITKFDAYACSPQVVEHGDHDLSLSSVEKVRKKFKTKRPGIPLKDLFYRRVRKFRHSIVKHTSLKIS
ncbi:hypothetical protein [Solemya velesiana gill symbiont]|uniref:Uncharacterized protein n=1 Tax=Solemya velesiana gill symbiont TaxID=1918948 RepID=A0A1T2KW19_9GAMM|nr:hypothetical protein [Solemya velesiana gill symbiont]OOZ37043.1 hypothetical protein BOW51_04330 [Solemya velesiana gill symbiont]